MCLHPIFQLRKLKQRVVCDLPKSQSKPSLEAGAESVVPKPIPSLLHFLPPSLNSTCLLELLNPLQARTWAGCRAVGRCISVQGVLHYLRWMPSVSLLGTAHIEVIMQDKATVTIIHSVSHQAFIEHQLCSRFYARHSINNKMYKCLV